MTLRIRLGKKLEDAPGHPTTTEIGYRPGLSEREYFDRARGIWRLNADAVLAEHDLFITSPNDEILAVATITGVRKFDERRVVEGDLKAGDIRVGTQITVPHPSRNSISYADEDANFWGTLNHARAVGIAALQDLASATLAEAESEEGEIEPYEWQFNTYDGVVSIHENGHWKVGLDSSGDTALREIGYGHTIRLSNLGHIDYGALTSLAASRRECRRILDCFTQEESYDPILRTLTS